jgi:tryptophan halogenase
VNIVIVGGGTAGWLAALFIKKSRPNHSVKVIESSKIGIVGAGEGSTGLLTDVITNVIWPFGLDINDFIVKTGAGLKYGIMHKNWKGDGSQYFAPLEGSPTSFDFPDGAFNFQNSGKNENHDVSFLGYCMNKNILPFEYSSSSPSSVTYIPYHALHFDAHKVGMYFKDFVTNDGSVDCVDAIVEDVVVGSDGNIKELILDNGSSVTGDFFVDATGFSRILMNKLGVKWNSYSDNLPVNSAMPFILDHKKKESPNPYTTAWAHTAGWVWQIPTLERKGCGYVFDDNFITPDQAQEEIESSLGHKIEPIRVLKFDTGRQEVLWKNNCLSIGLSAAFAEPLEATSIHSTIVQLRTFAFEFISDDVNKMCSDPNVLQYNNRMTKMYDDFKDFLVVHYQTGRSDSEFWKWISTGETKTEFVSHILDLCKFRVPNHHDFPQYFGHAGWALWSWVLSGIGAISPQLSREAIDYEVPGRGSYYNMLSESVRDWESMRNFGSDYHISYAEWAKNKKIQMKVQKNNV